MPQRSAEPTASDDRAPEPKKRSIGFRVLPAVIVVVGLLGGAKVMGLGTRGGSTEPTAAATTTTVAELHPVALDPMTVNLADGRFLKVQLGLGLREVSEEPEGGGDEDLKAKWAKALDRAVMVLGGMTYDQLVTAEGRAAAKGALGSELSALYDGQIGEIYFLEFVMQ